MCPWYDAYSQKCKLHGQYMDGYTRDNKCMSSSGCEIVATISRI